MNIIIDLLIWTFKTVVIVWGINFTLNNIWLLFSDK